MPGAVLALVALVPLGTGHLVAGLVGAVVLGGAFAAVHLAAPGALGAGDVKLAPALGAPLAAASWGGLVAAPVLPPSGSSSSCSPVARAASRTARRCSERRGSPSPRP